MKRTTFVTIAAFLIAALPSMSGYGFWETLAAAGLLFVVLLFLWKKEIDKQKPWRLLLAVASCFVFAALGAFTEVPSFVATTGYLLSVVSVMF